MTETDCPLQAARRIAMAAGIVGRVDPKLTDAVVSALEQRPDEREGRLRDAVAMLLGLVMSAPREQRTDLAVVLYQRDLLTRTEARRLAGLTAWDFQRAAAARSVGSDYEIADLEQELQQSKALGLW